ncbi:creatininase family protein [Aquamicrobium sp. LC103]|uniref:creatininase family protein n=1 Tax=Aquamicrobium sp. LC103 TaxID=1120658 RepID=UPI00063E9D83|nr:creatininase family protein [Aquamicrobium sp. LC103]TKT78354.1 creatininase family protein [Aquamicrobium sp. LC103]
MTFAEFRERLSEDLVVLLPFGSQEEQGPHAPMGDFMLTEAIALRVAEASGAVAAPTIPFGYADFFRTVPGGVQLRASTFTALVEDMVGAFLDHRVERLVILNGHTTNASLIDQTVRRIRRERGVAVASINIWQSIPDALWKKLHGSEAARARGHGGDPITSVYMHLFPNLLRPDLIRPSVRSRALGLPTGGVAGVQFEGIPVQLPLDATEINADGMLGGDATLASAEIGREIVDHIVGFAARFVEHFQHCDPRDVTFSPAREVEPS